MFHTLLLLIIKHYPVALEFGACMCAHECVEERSADCLDLSIHALTSDPISK